MLKFAKNPLTYMITVPDLKVLEPHDLYNSTASRKIDRKHIIVAIIYVALTIIIWAARSENDDAFVHNWSNVCSVAVYGFFYLFLLAESSRDNASTAVHWFELIFKILINRIPLSFFGDNSTEWFWIKETY
jgi:hypothetical protein